MAVWISFIGSVELARSFEEPDLFGRAESFASRLEDHLVLIAQVGCQLYPSEQCGRDGGGKGASGSLTDRWDAVDSRSVLFEFKVQVSQPRDE